MHTRPNTLTIISSLIVLALTGSAPAQSPPPNPWCSPEDNPPPVCQGVSFPANPHQYAVQQLQIQLARAIIDGGWQSPCNVQGAKIEFPEFLELLDGIIVEGFEDNMPCEALAYFLEDGYFEVLDGLYGEPDDYPFPLTPGDPRPTEFEFPPDSNAFLDLTFPYNQTPGVPLTDLEDCLPDPLTLPDGYLCGEAPLQGPEPVPTDACLAIDPNDCYPGMGPELPGGIPVNLPRGRFPVDPTKGPFIDPNHHWCAGYDCAPRSIHPFTYDDDASCFGGGSGSSPLIPSSGIGKAVVLGDMTLALPAGMNGNGPLNDILDIGTLTLPSGVGPENLFFDECLCLMGSGGAFSPGTTPFDLTNPSGTPGRPFSLPGMVPMTTPNFPSSQPIDPVELEGLQPASMCGDPMDGGGPEEPDEESLPIYISSKSGGAHGVSKYGASGSDATTCNPVAIPSGVKFESDTDLVVELPGHDFALTRTWSGGFFYERNENRWMVGRGWDFNTSDRIHYFEEEFNTDRPLPARIELRTVPREHSGYFIQDADDRMLFKPTGPSSTSVRMGTHTLSGTLDGATGEFTLPVWIMETPGEGRRIYYRTLDVYHTAVDSRGGAPVPLRLLDGKLLQTIDTHGNVHTYEYFHVPIGDETTPAAISQPLLRRIVFGADSIEASETPYAAMHFEYDVNGTPNSLDDTICFPGSGMVRRASVYRPIGDTTTKWLLTQYVSYVYSTDIDRDPLDQVDDFPFEIDLDDHLAESTLSSFPTVPNPWYEESHLLLVEAGTLVNPPVFDVHQLSYVPSDSEDWLEDGYASSFTLFRYNDDTGRLTHRFDASTIDFAAYEAVQDGYTSVARHHQIDSGSTLADTDWGGPSIQRSLVYDILSKPLDGAFGELYTSPELSVVHVGDLTSKIITYYGADDMGYGYPSLRGRVKAQTLRAGCGCGSGGDIVEEFTYFRADIRDPILRDPEDNIDIVISPTHRRVTSMIRKVSVKEEGGALQLEEMHVHHAEELREVVGFFAGPDPGNDPQGNPYDRVLVSFPIGADYVVANEMHEIDPLTETITRSWYSFNEYDDNLMIAREYGPDAVKNLLYYPLYETSFGQNNEFVSGNILSTSPDEFLAVGSPLLLGIPGLAPQPPTSGADSNALRISRAKFAVEFNSGAEASWTEYDLDDPAMTPLSRVTRTGIGRIDANGDIQSPITLREIIYTNPAATSFGERTDLVAEIRDFVSSGTSPEYISTRFEYITEPETGALKERVSAIEIRSDPDVNGDAELSRWMVFNDRGDMAASIDELGVYTAFTHHRETGGVVEVVRDAIEVDLPGGFVAPSGAPVAPTSGSLRRASQFARDATGVVRGVRREFDASSTNAPRRLRVVQSRLTDWPRFHESTASVQLHPGLKAIQTTVASLVPAGEPGTEWPGEIYNVWSTPTGVELWRAAIPPPASVTPDDWLDGNEADVYVNATASSTSASNLSSLASTSHDRFGYVNGTREWFDLDANLSYETTYKYDARGRLAHIEEPTGQITNYEHDVNGRIVSISAGKGASNVTLLSELFYDWNFTGGSPTQGVGDGELVLIRVLESTSGASRYSRVVYDWRGRPRLSFDVAQPSGPQWDMALPATLEVTQLDDLGRPTESVRFEGGQPLGTLISQLTGDTVDFSTDLPSSPIERLELVYGGRGLPIRVDNDATPWTTPTIQSVTTAYDSVGRVLATVAPGIPAMARQYDAIGRITEQYTIDAYGKSASDLAANPNGSPVIEKHLVHYHPELGFPSLAESWMRAHDETTTTAGLGANPVRTSGAHVYDDAARLYATISIGAPSTSSSGGVFGANADAITSTAFEDLFPGGSSSGFDATAITPYNVGSFPHALESSGDVLITRVKYDAVGLPFEMTDPEGRVARMLYDDLDRVVMTIENVNDPSNSLEIGSSKVRFHSAESRYEISQWPNHLGVTSQNRVTSRSYHADGSLRTLVSHRPGSSSSSDVTQVTEYIRDPDLATVALSRNVPTGQFGPLYEIRYPQPTDGAPGIASTDVVRYDYNLLGEQIAVRDQLGNIRALLRDPQGRLEHDEVETFFRDTDDTVRRISREYDGFGRLSTLTSHSDLSAQSGGTVLNQMLYQYDQRGRITRAAMNPVGAVEISTPPPGAFDHQGYVEYTYDDTTAHSRLLSMLYPANSENGANPRTVLTASYGGAGTIGDHISRLSGVTWDVASGAPRAESRHMYLGLSMPAVSWSMAENGTRLTRDRHIGFDGSGNAVASPGEYQGLDRFGRVRRHIWMYEDGVVPLATDAQALVNLEYAYSNAGNPLTRLDMTPGENPDPNNSRDTYFSHDDLNRLVVAARGPASVAPLDPDDDPGAQTDPSPGAHQGSEWFQYDHLGNREQHIAIGHSAASPPAAGFVSGNTLKDVRTFNETNEIDTVADGTISDPITFFESYAYDANGNTLTQPLSSNSSRTFLYDAWNRLVGVDYVKDNPSSPPTITPRTRYQYFGGHQRSVRLADEKPADQFHTPTVFERFYYDAGWRLVEVRSDDEYDTTPGAASWPGMGTLGSAPFWWRATQQHVWDPLTTDRLVQRRVSAPVNDGLTPSDTEWERPLTFTERWWAVTERNSDVLGEVPELGGVVYPERREHFRYSMFGVPSLDPLGDFQQDGAVNMGDFGYFGSKIGKVSTDPAYAQRADRNLDGTVDAVADHQGFIAEYGLSQYKGSYSSSGLMIGYAGAVWDPAVGLWLMRHRWLDPEGGRWLTRDPAGYVDGMSLYGYVGQRAWAQTDPLGLWPAWLDRAANWVGDAITNVGAAIGDAAAYVGDRIDTMAGGVIGGAISGALAGALIGAAGGPVGILGGLLADADDGFVDGLANGAIDGFVSVAGGVLIGKAGQLLMKIPGVNALVSVATRGIAGALNRMFDGVVSKMMSTQLAQRLQAVIGRLAAQGSTLTNSMFSRIVGAFPISMRGFVERLLLGKTPMGIPVGKGLAGVRDEGCQLPNGSFSLTPLGLKGYPEGVPLPKGPMRLIPRDVEYEAARKAADRANARLRRWWQTAPGDDIHEIVPVKWGGSPIDPNNKIPLDKTLHRLFITPWWNRLQKELEKYVSYFLVAYYGSHIRHSPAEGVLTTFPGRLGFTSSPCRSSRSQTSS